MDARTAPEPPLPGYEIFDPIDPFENECAGPFWAKKLEDGSYSFVLKAEPRHCNRHGIVHGGLLMTMADLTACVHAHGGSGEEFAITVAFNSEFIDAGKVGELVECTAEVTRRTNSLVFARGRIHVGGRTIYTYSSVMKRIRERK